MHASERGDLEYERRSAVFLQRSGEESNRANANTAPAIDERILFWSAPDPKCFCEAPIRHVGHKMLAVPNSGEALSASDTALGQETQELGRPRETPERGDS